MFNVEQLQAELAQLRAENARLKEKKKRRARCKNNADGNVTFLSSEGFQVTLSPDKWLKLLNEEKNVVLDFLSGANQAETEETETSEVA